MTVPYNFIILNYNFWNPVQIGGNRWREMGHILAEKYPVTSISSDSEFALGNEVSAVEVSTFRKKNKTSEGFASTKQSKLSKYKIGRFCKDLFFFPDTSVYWAREAVGKLDELLRPGYTNVIITSSPSPSVHYATQQIIDKLSPRPIWIMDLRDPWAFPAGSYYQTIPKLLKWRAQRAERRCHFRADIVVSIGKVLGEILTNFYDAPCETIYNGCNRSLFVDGSNPQLKPLRIRYHGRIIPKLRSPELLFQAAKELNLSERDLVFEFWCNQPDLIKDLAVKYRVNHMVKTFGRVEHSVAITQQREAAANLVLNGLDASDNYILTTKLFELMASANPVIGVTNPSSEIAEVFHRCGMNGIISNSSDAIDVLKLLKSDGLKKPNSNRFEYTREAGVEKLLELLGRARALRPDFW